MYEQYGEIREVFNLIEKRGMVFVTFVSFPPLVFYISLILSIGSI